jgi:hypothetical protein
MRRQRSNVMWSAALALGALAIFGSAGGAAPQERPAARSEGLEVMPVQGNVHMIAGAGANIAVSVRCWWTRGAARSPQMCWRP